MRIKSILTRYAETGRKPETCEIRPACSSAEKALMMQLVGFNAMIEAAFDEIAPHKVCAYIYELANAFNRFYHETKILTEEDGQKQEGWIALLLLTRDVLETCIDLLGFSAPERM